MEIVLSEKDTDGFLLAVHDRDHLMKDPLYYV